MEKIVGAFNERGVESVIDFGCGKGRNAGPLADNFSKVYLVEAEKNLELVREWIKGSGCTSCQALGYEAFKAARLKADACLLSFVLHTLPTSGMREDVIKTIKAKLKKRGTLALVSPAYDSKYTADKLKSATKFGDGIARLLPDGTFSFYKKYTLQELLDYIAGNGFEICGRIPGDNRYIVLTSPRG
jgi:2-polyprenyl-3-methyl-5-hydroxy-6-metoxy-1,4-benzoquinol methylase